ncbi:hypothetical protein CLAIMM_14521, partial [Cladophialophora immunda]
MCCFGLAVPSTEGSCQLTNTTCSPRSRTDEDIGGILHSSIPLAHATGQLCWHHHPCTLAATKRLQMHLLDETELTTIRNQGLPMAARVSPRNVSSECPRSLVGVLMGRNAAKESQPLVFCSPVLPYGQLIGRT